MSSDKRTNVVLALLMGVVIFLMIAIIGLFVRMNQLQNRILASLQADNVQITGLAVGTQAPEFTLSDVHGSTVSLQDFAGQMVLVGFSSTQCPACAEMYPSLGAFSTQNPDIQVLLISAGTLEENQRLEEAQGFGFPILTLTQDDSQIGRDYQVPGTPFFYVIDEQGRICSAGFANTREHLESLVSDCR